MALRFRRRGNGMQVLRVTATANSDRIVASAIGSLPLTGEKIPSALLNVVTADEKSEILLYIENREKIRALRIRLSAIDLQQIVNDAGQYLMETDDIEEKSFLINNFKECLIIIRSILMKEKRSR